MMRWRLVAIQIVRRLALPFGGFAIFHPASAGKCNTQDQPRLAFLRSAAVLAQQPNAGLRDQPGVPYPHAGTDWTRAFRSQYKDAVRRIRERRSKRVLAAGPAHLDAPVQRSIGAGA